MYVWPHGQLVFTHPGAVATWGQSAHALDEEQLGGAAVVQVMIMLPVFLIDPGETRRVLGDE